MSTIVLAKQDFADLSVVPKPPAGEYVIGFDIDNEPKVKFSDGRIVSLFGSNGPTGPAGPTGPQGASVGGGNSLVWQAGNSTLSGQFDYPSGNWGTIGGAYDIRINNIEALASSSAVAWFNALNAGLNFVGPSKGIFSIYQTNNNADFALFTLNSATDNTTYWTVNGTLLVYCNSPSLSPGVNYNISWVLFGKDAIGGGGSASLDIQANSGIVEISGTSSVLLSTKYDTLLDDALTTPVAVGGIASGTSVSTLRNKNLVQLFDDLLFPTVLPGYVIPTISISSGNSGIREVGLTLSNNLITAVGTKNDAGAFTSISIFRTINGGSNTNLLTTTPVSSSATSLASQFGYANSNNPNFSYTGTFSETIQVPTYSVSNSSITYLAYGDYSAGLALKNNKGVDDSRTPAVRSSAAPQAASTNFGPASVSIIGYYPYFYGVANSQVTPAQIKAIIESGTGYTKVVNTGSGSLSMAFNGSSQYPWFAIFSSYTTKTTWFVNSLNSGNIGGASDLFLSPTTLSITSPDGLWVAEYKIYPPGKVTTIPTAIIS